LEPDPDDVPVAPEAEWRARAAAAAAAAVAAAAFVASQMAPEAGIVQMARAGRARERLLASQTTVPPPPPPEPEEISRPSVWNLIQQIKPDIVVEGNDPARAIGRDEHASPVEEVDAVPPSAPVAAGEGYPTDQKLLLELTPTLHDDPSFAPTILERIAGSTTGGNKDS
jgi:hypothetical protein